MLGWSRHSDWSVGLLEWPAHTATFRGPGKSDPHHPGNKDQTTDNQVWDSIFFPLTLFLPFSLPLPPFLPPSLSFYCSLWCSTCLHVLYEYYISTYTPEKQVRRACGHGHVCASGRRCSHRYVCVRGLLCDLWSQHRSHDPPKKVIESEIEKERKKKRRYR